MELLLFFVMTFAAIGMLFFGMGKANYALFFVGSILLLLTGFFVYSSGLTFYEGGKIYVNDVNDSTTQLVRDPLVLTRNGAPSGTHDPVIDLLWQGFIYGGLLLVLIGAYYSTRG